jgi:hypothetical protein
MQRMMVVVALVVAACSGSGSSSGASTAQVKQVDTLGQGMTATVSSYRASVAGTTTPQACQAAERAYEGQIAPMMDQMKQMSGAMDNAMKQLGHPEGADVTCGSGAMQAELDRHKPVACASPDMAVNKSEAASHADAMDELIDHQRARAAQAGSAMGVSGMMDAGSMSGAAGGWTAPDGGMMGACQLESDGGYTMDGGMTDGGMMGGARP